jgi:hypothetical protein
MLAGDRNKGGNDYHDAPANQVTTDNFVINAEIVMFSATNLQVFH